MSEERLEDLMDPRPGEWTHYCPDCLVRDMRSGAPLRGCSHLPALGAEPRYGRLVSISSSTLTLDRAVPVRARAGWATSLLLWLGVVVLLGGGAAAVMIAIELLIGP